MTQYLSSNQYRSHGLQSQSRRHKLSVHYGVMINQKSRNKHNKQSLVNYDDPSVSRQNFEDAQELKSQNQRLKRFLKQSNAKRSSLVKQCSEYQKHIQQLQRQVQKLRSNVDEQKIDKEGDRYRVEQLKFLNKQLSGQINQLRDENQCLMEKVRYCSQVVQKKYQGLQQKMMKRMQQAIKRVKRSIHYLQSLSIKDIQKTKQMLVENLKRANQLLKGKYTEQTNAEYEIQQLMNPLKSLQEDLSLRDRELALVKNQNNKLSEQLKKHKRIQQQLLPQYKQSIQGLKKNLAQVRLQLSENDVEKVRIKKRCQQKVKGIELQYSQLLIEYRRNKLQKKIFQNKLEELQQEKEQEKERLVGQNQMLKKLYGNKRNTNHLIQLDNQDSSLEQSRGSEVRRDQSLKRTTNFKKNKYRQGQDYSQIIQGQDDLDDCKSVDYYNNHKTNKDTYGDQPANQKRLIAKNSSSKELRNPSQNQQRVIPLEKNKRDQHRVISRQKDQRSNNLNNHRMISRQREQRTNNLKQMTNSGLNSNKSRSRNHNQPEQMQRARSYKQKQSQEQSQNSSVQVQSDQHQEQQYEFAEPGSQYCPQDSSMISQQSLKNQICKIDHEIMQIQKNLTKQLQAYK